MFKAIKRWFKAVIYLFTGQIDSARRTLDTNPNVVRATYDSVITDKTKNIQQYKQTVAGLIAQQENKIAKVKDLTGAVEKLARMKAGALAKARQKVGALKKEGKSGEAIRQDADYSKCLMAYNDFSSTLKEKHDRITDLETDIEQNRKRIDEHKKQLQALKQEIGDVRSEASEAVADIISAKQEKELNDTLAGIAQDGTGEELQRLRQIRQEVQAEAKISRELSGEDAKSQEAEFLEYAAASQSNDEFDALLGLGSEKDAAQTTGEPAAKETGEASPLPE